MTYGYEVSLREPFLTIAPVYDQLNRRILLLHSDSLCDSLTEYDITSSLDRIRPSSTDVLIYLHGGLGMTTNSTLSKARKFRRIIDMHVKSVPAMVIGLHVSFLSRAHATVTSRFSGIIAREMYNKLQYCDLIEDLEKLLGIDACMLGLRSIDLNYDEVMRTWVGRNEAQQEQPNQLQQQQQPEPQQLFEIESSPSQFHGSAASSSSDVFDITSMKDEQPIYLDPSKPLIDLNSVSFDGTLIEQEQKARRQIPRYIGEEL